MLKTVNADTSPSLFIKIIGFLTIFLCGPVAFVWFCDIAYELISELITLSSIIRFEKGLFYFCGGSIVLSAVFFSVVCEVLLRKQLSSFTQKVIRNLMVIGFVVLFALPLITHYLVSDYTESKGYEVCHEAGQQWLHSRTIVYVKSSEICQQLVADENQK